MIYAILILNFVGGYLADFAEKGIRDDQSYAVPRIPRKVVIQSHEWPATGTTAVNATTGGIMLIKFAWFGQDQVNVEEIQNG